MINRSDTERAAKGKIPIVRLTACGKRRLQRVPADAPVKAIAERTASGEVEQ